MRVLLVHDDAAQAQAIRACLQGKGGAGDVDVASSLARGLDLARTQTFDAALLGPAIADTHARDAIGRLRERIPGLPIVVFTKKSDKNAAKAAVEAGAQDALAISPLDEDSLRRTLRYAIDRSQLLERLRRLTDAAGSILATFDVRGVVGLLAAEARHLLDGMATLYELRANGDLVCVDATAARPKADPFLYGSLASRHPVLSDDRRRLALPVPGTSGSNEWVLDIASVGEEFGEDDVFALELLRQYTGIAIQNVALFGELQSQRASVIELNQLKDDLIAVLAHDFKGPLTTIIGFTDLLEKRALEGEEAEDALRTIRHSAGRLASLANDTLVLSRVEQGELNLATDPVNIATVVTDAVEGLKPDRHIDVDVRAADPVVRGDPARLRQVFENVIGNAIKYSPDSESVIVIVTETETTVRVSVADRGIGIPLDEMRFLFERFTRGSNAKSSKIKGTGLGLYLARTLVERHGGNIQVQSKLNQGSTFTVVLPRMRDGRGGVLRVIVLTADDNLGSYVLHALRSHGFAARRDKTLTGLLERLHVEDADIVIVDRDTVRMDMTSLFTFAAGAKPRVGLISVGGRVSGGRFAADAGSWQAHLPNPFLGSDLQDAIVRADRARLETT